MQNRTIDVDEKRGEKQRNLTPWMRLWRHAWPVGCLGLLCAAFYWDVLWLPSHRIVAGNDLSNMFLHWLSFARSSIQRGQLPLWNPYLFAGVPFVANPQPALFYPPTWLALLMPVTRALGWIILLHVWLAGVGMYGWMRSEGASAAGALLAAVTFAFSGYFFVRVYAGHLGVITTGAWLPLVLWAFRRAVKRRSWKLAVLGGLPVGLSILAGHTASFIYVALGLAAYAAFHAWVRWREERSPRAALAPVAWAGVMVLVGLALAAVQLVPMAELAARSTRQAASGYDFASRFSWPPGYLLTLLVPNFFGEPVRTGYWGDGIYDELIFYVGVLPLLAALLGLRLRHRLSAFLGLLALGALLLAFGQYGSLHPLFFRFVPLFRVARAPARAGFLFTVAVAALAGLTWTALESSGREVRTRLLEPVRGTGVLAVAGGALALVVAGFVAFALGREANPAAGRLWHQANQVASFVFFFLLAAGLLIALRGASAQRAWPGLLAVGLVVLDLWTFGSGVVQVVDVQESAYWRIVAQAVPNPLESRVLPWGLSTFDQNWGMPFELRSIFGYDPLHIQRYEEFTTSWPDPRARTYDLLNAGYVVTTAPLEFDDEDGDQPEAPRKLLKESGVTIYERPNALPRAWVVPQVEVVEREETLARIHAPDFDPRSVGLVESPLACEGGDVADPGAVEVLRYEGNRIEARVKSGGGLLIFSEVYYPGWRATVDGGPVPLVRADYLLRALCVPAGEHQVVLVYDPLSVKVGLAVTGLVALALVGVGAWTARQRGALARNDAATEAEVGRS